MKKMIPLIVIAVMLTGCMNMKDTFTKYQKDGKTVESVRLTEKELPTTEKLVKLEEDVNAVAVSFYDLQTGTFAPYLKLGFFKIQYHSFPIVKGQPVFVQYKTYSNSWWNWIALFSKNDSKTNVVSETTIWVGYAKENAVLNITTSTGLGVNGNSLIMEGISIENKKITGK